MDFGTIADAIANGEFVTECGATEWGGAGAAISATLKPDWLNDERIVYCCTPNAKEYIWLLNKLKPIVDIDYLTKYDYYPDFMKKVIDVETNSSEECIEVRLLLVLKHVAETTNQLIIN